MRIVSAGVIVGVKITTRMCCEVRTIMLVVPIIL